MFPVRSPVRVIDQSFESPGYRKCSVTQAGWGSLLRASSILRYSLTWQGVVGVSVGVTVGMCTERSINGKYAEVDGSCFGDVGVRVGVDRGVRVLVGGTIVDVLVGIGVEGGVVVWVFQDPICPRQVS